MERLTPRQREVAGLCCRYSNTEIAARLGITINTVKCLLRVAFFKVGLVDYRIKPSQRRSWLCYLLGVDRGKRSREVSH